MRRPALLVALALALALPSCVDGGAVLGPDGRLTVSEVLEPGPGCALDEAATSLVAGTLDLAFADTYEATVELRNLDGDDVLVEGVDVEVWLADDADGEPFFDFSTLAPAFVPAGGTTMAEVAVLPRSTVDTLVPLIAGSSPDALAPGWEARLSIALTVRGRTVGGRTIASPERLLPLTLCVGCLVTCPPESAGGPDDLLCESTDPPDEEPCRLGQDADLDCRHCVPYHDAATCRAMCAL